MVLSFLYLDAARAFLNRVRWFDSGRGHNGSRIQPSAGVRPLPSQPPLGVPRSSQGVVSFSLMTPASWSRMRSVRSMATGRRPPGPEW